MSYTNNFDCGKYDCDGEGQTAVKNDRPVLSSERATCNRLTLIKIWSWVPDGSLTSRQTGRQTVNRKVTLTLSLSQLASDLVKKKTAAVQLL
jgi:hypothetical protein